MVMLVAFEELHVKVTGWPAIIADGLTCRDTVGAGPSGVTVTEA
jgi:hypothetical protein